MNASDLVARIASVEAKLRTRAGTFDVKPLVTGKPLSEATVRAFEKRIGHPLPKLLREVYGTIGARLAFRWRFKKGMAKSFAALGTWGAEPWGALLIDAPLVEETSDGTTYVCFGDDDNGRRYALDYSAKNGATVVSYDHETVDDAREVARSVSAFLDHLSARGFVHVEDDTDQLDAFFKAAPRRRRA